mmetsp:Transcript_80836/g.205448  ORF Transcript_80836/g.205448 Transcript_80836/m.205448 type:complete len:89 (-) Transcript_80836:1348-1614(-)
MEPPSMTQILSAPRMVESRWAMMTVVRCDECTNRNISSCNSFSVCTSAALVGSSNRNTAGARMSARAMAIRCFSPPLKCPPRAPTCVP